MRNCLLALLFASAYALTAQNVLISYQNPDALWVCTDDQTSFVLRNTGTDAVANLRFTLRLPAGVQYVAGSVNGATEANISNLGAPVFSVGNLAAGAQANVTVTLHATCALVPAINSGKLFANTIEATWTGGNTQVETTTYIIETPLLLIVSVTPSTLSGEAGDVLTRTITVRNTRKGPLGGFSLTDQHIPGMFFDMPGATNPTVTNVQYRGNFEGDFFKSVGDGDALFEEGETVVLTQKITITDCKPFIFTNPSTIRVAWGCDGQECQSDTAVAYVTINPTQKNPNLAFYPQYRPPLNQCAETPARQELLIVNTGLAPAQNVTLALMPDPPGVLGIDLASVEWNSGNGWQPITSGSGTKLIMAACGSNDRYYRELSVSIPFVPAQDSTWVRFNTYTCSAPCTKPYVPILGRFFYNKACPDTEVVDGKVNFVPDTTALAISSKVYYDIGVCMDNEQRYDMTYWVKSKRLLESGSFLQVNIVIPWGVYWQPDCLPSLDGKTPLEWRVDSIKDQNTTLRLSYALPMSKDSVAGTFCLLNLCKKPEDYVPSIDSVPARGKDFTVYPGDADCAACVQNLTAITMFTDKKDLGSNCGFSACDEFQIVLDCGCDDPAGNLKNKGKFTFLEPLSFNAWRLNRGLRDDNDDRTADGTDKADPTKIRLDRFLPADTMRTQLHAVALPGVGKEVGFRIFHESWLKDMNLGGADQYDIASAKSRFVNFDIVRYISGSLVIKTKDGKQYTCTVPTPTVRSDQHIITIATPNVRPEKTEDVGASMFNEFTFNTDKLSASGCLPPGFVLQPGDSLIFTNDFRFGLNFVPLGSNLPPLINFRSTLCGTRNIYANRDSVNCGPGILLQYSGVIERFNTPTYAIQPCTTSTEITPLRYEIRIARGNLFPFEVRRLTDLVSFQHGLVPGIPILEARLRSLILQENTPIFSDLVMPHTAGSINFNVPLTGKLTQPLDEGYKLEMGFLFGQGCAFKDKQFVANSLLRVNYANNVLRSPLSNTLDSTRVAYFNNRPKIDFLALDTIVNVNASNVTYEFSLINTSPIAAAHVWMSLDTDGALGNIEVVTLPDGNPVTAVAGIYQFGALGGAQRINIRLKAGAEVCKSTSVRVYFGWDCVPLTNLSGLPCGTASKILELKPKFPELELVPLAQPSPIRLCQPSNFFEFEIYNANEGQAYDVTGQLRLPPGFSVVPGSSELSYPSGSAYVSLPDPTAQANNTWLWEPEKTSQTLRDNGLPGVSKAPDNSMRIRFKIQAECGAVANAQPVFGSDAARVCGNASNSLRKPGLPIRLLGENPSYEVTANLKATTSVDCGKEVEIIANLAINGNASPGDSIYLNLPAGTSYVDGSYVPASSNAPAGPPAIAGQRLRLPIPTGIPVGAALSFRFKIKYDGPAGCADKLLTLQTREQATALCGTQSCSIFLNTGEAFLTLPARNPDLTLKEPTLRLQNGTFTFSGNIENTGTVQATTPKVQVFVDQNNNGRVDPGEPQIGNYTLNQNLSPGATRLLSGNLDIGNANICQLLAFIPAAENCACADKTIPIGARPVVTTPIGLCKLEAVPLKTDSLAGHTYQWTTPDGIACPTCANTIYTPTPDVATGQLVTLVLEDRSGNCVVERRFEIKFGGQLGSSTQDQTLCRGESLQLEATPGGTTYRWQSTPTSTFADPTSPIQIVQPTVANITYRVTVTFQGGCTGTDEIRIRTVTSPTTNLTRVTCVGDPVDIFGQLTDEAGVYTKIFTSFRGCDSTVTINLKVPVSQTEETRALCQGDSLRVGDSLFTKPGFYFDVQKGFQGCDSIHTVNVRLVQPPSISQPDTIFVKLGEQATLQGPSGLASYIWTPSTHLSCANCPQPTFQGDTSISYLLRVSDVNSCRAEVVYRVVVFPPCFSRFVIPNAFTPNGDELNDVFRVVPYEGFEAILSMKVYNRWGRLVYEGSGKNAGWDGTINGELAPMDGYVWIIEAECQGEKKALKGDVGLIR